MGFVTYTTFLMAISFQCFLYCHGGTKLEVESEAVADAVYGSKWYVAKATTQRTVWFFLMRSQKRIVVKSVFFNASLATFTSV